MRKKKIIKFKCPKRRRGPARSSSIIEFYSCFRTYFDDYGKTNVEKITQKKLINEKNIISNLFTYIQEKIIEVRF